MFLEALLPFLHSSPSITTTATTTSCQLLPFTTCISASPLHSLAAVATGMCVIAFANPTPPPPPPPPLELKSAAHSRLNS
ncbi:hypothetical protein E2C01_067788 [Portunus trituberculatus]|uniref:Uncharacterized protein n=1 Tax=Portunus trituberculatus TaxID=210409 RepID=A0A5B7HUM0_PORTR|nr:hypothetical protein [Portunus trituberculatus]